MKAKATALLLADLGVTRSHNRPHTSNDDPFSESHFKTLKYQPQFPQRFGCIEDARSFYRSFFRLVQSGTPPRRLRSDDTGPSALGVRPMPCMPPASRTLDHAFRANPERFVNKIPAPPAKPSAAWINPPMPNNRT